MRVVATKRETRAELDRCRRDGAVVGFVPTMGFLHEGHASLMRAAGKECDVVVVSIFVNPLQFGPSEDLAAYPRDLDRDLSMCRAEGVDVVFHPSVEEMYSGSSAVRVTVASLGEVLCGRTRPGHFDGVATVVAKLFNIVGPCRAYFGCKDAQQLVVIERMAGALDLPVDVIGCPTVREADGLAMSSRNTYLGPAERGAATVLRRALDAGIRVVEKGGGDGAKVVAAMTDVVSAEKLARLDYAECVDPVSLQPVDEIVGPVLLALAVWMGKARLIDNETASPLEAAVSGRRERGPGTER